MQAKAARGCERALQALKEYLDCLETRLRGNLYLDCMESKDCIEVIVASNNLAKLTRRLGTIAYTYGIHVARYCDGRLIVNLGLLQVVERVEDHYVVVAERGEKLFLYGRDLLEESITELHVNNKCRQQPLVVLNQRREPIGFGRLRARKGRIIIENVIDLGWYLRSGV